MISLSEESAGGRHAALAAWRAVPKNDRVEVCKLAKQGRRHPDARVAACATNWARTAKASRRNLALPLVGIALVIAGLLLGSTDPSGGVVGIVGGGAVFLIGLLAWNTRKIAKLILALPTAELVDS